MSNHSKANEQSSADDLARKLLSRVQREVAKELPAEKINEILAEFDSAPALDEDSQPGVHTPGSHADAAFFAVLRAAGNVEMLVAAFCSRHAQKPVMNMLEKTAGGNPSVAVQMIYRMLTGLSQTLERTMPAKVRTEQAANEDVPVAKIEINSEKSLFRWRASSFEGDWIELLPFARDAASRLASMPMPQATPMAELVVADLASELAVIPHFSRSAVRGKSVELAWSLSVLHVTAEDLAQAWREENGDKVNRDKGSEEIIRVKKIEMPGENVGAGWFSSKGIDVVLENYSGTFGASIADTASENALRLVARTSFNPITMGLDTGPVQPGAQPTKPRGKPGGQ
jgi:hypothetical protein